MEKLICNVCNKEIALSVCSSTLGAISFAYCKACLNSGAEPYGILVGITGLMGGIDKCGNGIDKIISASLKVANKTIEEFKIDVAKSMAEDEENWARIGNEDVEDFEEFEESEEPAEVNYDSNADII